MKWKLRVLSKGSNWQLFFSFIVIILNFFLIFSGIYSSKANKCIRNICLLIMFLSRCIISLLLFYSLIFMIFCSSMRRSSSVAGVIDVTNRATPITGGFGLPSSSSSSSPSSYNDYPVLSKPSSVRCQFCRNSWFLWFLLPVLSFKSDSLVPSADEDTFDSLFTVDYPLFSSFIS